MRKTDLKEGEDYAVGAQSDRGYRGTRATVVEINGYRTEPNGKTRRGIVVRFADDQKYRYGSTKAGNEYVLDSARDIIGPWTPYADRKAEYDKAEDVRRKERERKLSVGRRVKEALDERGMNVRTNYGTDFIVSADNMAMLLGLSPGEEDGGS